MERKPGTKHSSDKLHILDYWRIIRVRIATILLVFLLTAITTTVVTFLIPATYMSLSRIAVEKDTSDIAPLMGMQATQSSFDPYFISTEFEKIQSQVVLDEVVKISDLKKRWKDLYEWELNDQQARKQLEKVIDVSQYHLYYLQVLRCIYGLNDAPLA